ncbi:hypothetical protein TRFO_18246 [Tritrichomonas foetus]|uniref:V-type proton ATPase subunit E n=1 Tax=Tritrichomonas foetus TaxID=1144522 RepID=A0A1J4KRF9_9EUKA|nr:hypothetical protein TRFO_18246 [Tritrichomonas foetus]|eukprot:OHT12053.1 hypothetical protein TRFO_18246 [Tritrichomonas foetus]
MNSNYAAEMIKKMKASIAHQAETNAEQIREAAKQDSDRIKLRQIYQAQMKIAEENKLREKQIRAQKSVKLSIANGQQRMKVLKIRDEAVNSAMEKATEQLKEYVKKPEYPELLYKLCLQGVLSLNEDKVEIAVTAADAEIFNSKKSNIASEYKKRTEKDVEISLSSYVLPDQAIGGCVVIAKEGKLQCSNTLMDRLSLSCKDLYPKIREIFFAK